MIKIIVAVFLLVFAAAPSALAQFSFGDDIDKINIGDTGIQVGDGVDSVNVGDVDVDASGNVKVKNVEVGDAVDSIHADEVEVDAAGNAKVTNVRGEDSVDSFEVEGVETNVNAEGEVEISIDGASVRSATTSEEKAITAATEVKSDEDLKVYVVTSMKTDKNLDKVDFKSDTVNVSYSLPARFLGIVPMKLAYAIGVDTAKKEVKITLPWWHIFTWKSIQPIKIETDIKNKLEVTVDNNSVGAAGATVNLTANAKADTLVIKNLQIKAGAFSAVVSAVATD
jgi:hypothetical protein